MRKRVSRDSVFKSPLMKAIPISMALSMISAGMIYAQTESINVEMADGKIAKFNCELMQSNPTYKTAVQDALKKAFTSGGAIEVKDTDNENWIDFGKNTKDGVTYQNLVAGTGKTYSVGNPNFSEEAIIAEDGTIKYIPHGMY